jgi:type IX secretion system PorP/SprF family membrane protein
MENKLNTVLNTTLLKKERIINQNVRNVRFFIYFSRLLPCIGNEIMMNKNKIFMKKALLLMVLCVGGVSVYGQQDPQFTFFMFDKLSFNPAAAGECNTYCFNSFYRYQYGSFNYNAPRTLLINGSARLGKSGMKRHGAGLSLMHDNIGNLTSTYLKGSYAYKIPMGQAGELSIGASVGFQHGALLNRWIPVTGTAAMDPNIPVNNVSEITFDAAAGIYFSKGRDYYAGLSFTHIAPLAMDSLNYKLAPNMYAMGGYRVPLGQMIGANKDMGITAHALVKSDFSVFSFDIGAIYDVEIIPDNVLLAGLSYRYTEDVNIILGWEGKLSGPSAPKLRVAYSYGFRTNNYITPDTGSHELTVGFCFDPKPPSKVNPYRNTINF